MGSKLRQNAKRIKEKTIVGSKKLKKSNIEKKGYKKESILTKTEGSSTEGLKYLRYSVNERYSTERQLFLKKNISNELSLIVSNIPAYLPHGTVEAFLAQFVPVPITEVITQRSNSIDGSLSFGQLTSSVIFETAQGVLLALDQCQCVGPYRVSDFINLELPTVFKSSIEKYRSLFHSSAEIEAVTSEYMQRQDENLIEAKREAKRKYTKPDDDGWITVTKAAKKVGKVIKVKRNEVPLVGGLNKKKKQVDLAFYSFQAKESKIKKLNELRAKFEEDKKRVALLRNTRKFNPS